LIQSGELIEGLIVRWQAASRGIVQGRGGSRGRQHLRRQHGRAGIEVAGALAVADHVVEHGGGVAEAVVQVLRWRGE